MFIKIFNIHISIIILLMYYYCNKYLYFFGEKMSYDKEKYYQEHVNSFKNFIKLGAYTSIGVIILLILMAIFLV